MAADRASIYCRFGTLSFRLAGRRCGSFLVDRCRLRQCRSWPERADGDGRLFSRDRLGPIDAFGGLMTSRWRGLASTILLPLIAAFIGVWAGANYFERDRAPKPSLHEMIHDRFDLTAEQDARLDAIEKRFATERERLQSELRAANAELATAIRAERKNGPQVAAAIDHFHGAMGRLQKATVAHVFAMRSVLTPAQAAEFDRTVVEALTAEAR